MRGASGHYLLLSQRLVHLVTTGTPPHKVHRPGPLLDLNNHPRLLQLVGDIALSTGQPIPSEVYAWSDVNAGVTERGGIFGARKRRVMIIGLPLFSLLTVSQLRSVLAHEFGHYYWGDTRLGPWIYRTSQAIDLTLEGLVQAQYTAWINLFSFWYDELFHSVVHDSMKKQEFLADRLATQIAGSKAHVEAMQLLHIGDDAFKAYWSGTIGPLADFGLRVPVLEGFSRFLAAQGIASSIERKVVTRLEENTAWHGDYHPMLSERVAAVTHMPAADHMGEDLDASALTLLGNMDELDFALLAHAIGKESAKKLTFVSWEEALTKAYLPMWTQAVCTYAPGLAGVTPESLPDIVKNLSLFGMEMLSKSNRAEQFDSLSKSVSTTLGSALTLALHKAGWELHVSPGEPVYAQRGATRIEPFSILARLLTHRLSAEEWRKQCTQAGIAGLDFGKLSEV